jgi:hypothetical protein
MLYLKKRGAIEERASPCSVVKYIYWKNLKKEGLDVSNNGIKPSGMYEKKKNKKGDYASITRLKKGVSPYRS